MASSAKTASTATGKDKGKAKETPTATAIDGAGAASTTSTSTHMHTTGDWTAVWNAERNQYYFWNRQTNTTTWDNPLVGAGAGAVAGTASTTEASNSTTASNNSGAPEASSPSGSKDATSSTTATETAKAAVPDYGGIDPDLAYLDPSLSARTASTGGSAPFQARFNARTGRFEGDPTKNPDRVGDVQRAKRQNQHYFDYESWEKTLANSQEEQAKKRANGEIDDDEANKRRKPSRKEMEAIRARNKEKKDKKQKGWLLND